MGNRTADAQSVGLIANAIADIGAIAAAPISKSY